MKLPPPHPGRAAKQRLTVGPTNRITFADARLPAVLATPWAVAQRESTSRAIIAPCVSAGIHADVGHLASVPVRHPVVRRVRVGLAAGSVDALQVEAHDGLDLNAPGPLRRRVIDVVRFARRVTRLSLALS